MRTYGTLTLERGRGDGERDSWVIQTEPHVSLRVKRLFGRAAKNGTPGHIEILATDETSRDMRWLLERYPLQMGERDRDELEFRSAAFEQRVVDVERILSGVIEPRAFDMALPPRDYQRVAAEAALRTKGLLVADDVGLGKTICAIAMLTEPSTRPALVVTLTHLTTQWARELARFAPSLRVHVVKKRTPYGVTGEDGRFPDVLVTNYHKLAGWADTLTGTVRTVIFDEVQELRRGDASAKGEAAQEIAVAAQYRLGLSATPVYNYGGEFFHVMEALRPGALGSLDEFLREWCHERYDRPERASVRDPVAFGSYVRETGLMIRRTRSDVSRELPEVMVIPQHVDADMEALNRVSVDVAELARVILGPTSEFTERGQAARELDWKLRQATGIAKAPYVAAFVRLLVESGERVVFYGWHRVVYSIWMDLLKDLDPVMFTGSESVTQKDAARDTFIDGRAKVLVMSLRAGQGIDGLQKVSRTVVFGELDWSPGVHEQCLDQDTEVLTREGFARMGSVRVGQDVAAFNKATGAIEWCPAEGVIVRSLGDEEMYALTSPTVDLRVTAGHRMLCQTKVGSGHKRWSPWEFHEADVLARRSQAYRIPVAGLEDCPGVSLTDAELSLVGWFLTDGSLNRRSRQLVISQAEASPFNEAIVRCLDGCGFKYGITKTLAGTGSQWSRCSDLLRYYVAKQHWARLEPYLDKDLSPLLDAITERQLGVLLEAMHMGDGAKQVGQLWTRRSYHIGTHRPVLADRLQSLCVRRGWRANVAERKTPAGCPHYTMHLRRSAVRSLAGTSNEGRPMLSRTSASPTELVWCVRNALETLVVRRSGKVAIVGNCIGRVHRDGQADPVAVYYLLSDSGSDPVVADVLGIKKQQIEGLRDPNAPRVEAVTTKDGGIKRLAAEYLARRGEKVVSE